MPRLSIIIAAQGEGSALEETLLAVLENRPEDCEVIVAHPSSYADPYALDGEVRFVALPAAADRLACLRAAVAASEGDILHVLACGAAVEPGWTDEALVFFADRRVGAVVPLVMDGRDHTRIISAGVHYHLGGARLICGAGQVWHERMADRLRPLGPSLAAGFYRRSALELVGGMAATECEAMADIDLALSLNAGGYTTVLAPESRVYGPLGQNARQDSAWTQGLAAERLFWRHAPQASWVAALASHALVVLRELFVQPLRTPLGWAGRAWALLTTNSPSRAARPKLAVAPETARDKASTPKWQRLDRAHAPPAGERPSDEPIRRQAS